VSKVRTDPNSLHVADWWIEREVSGVCGKRRGALREGVTAPNAGVRSNSALHL